MLRALYFRPCQNVILKEINKKFLETSSCLKYMNNVNRSKLYSSCFCSAYFMIDENRNIDRKTSFSLYRTGSMSLHTSAEQFTALKTAALDLNKASSAFFKIRMVDLKQAPLPAFWIGMVGLVPLIFPPLSSLIIGYSHFLTSVQFLYAAALLSCMGGIKWGSIINQKEAMTWENFGLSIVPCSIAVMALMLPKFMGFLVLIGGFLAAFVIDLTTSGYPVWFITLRGVLTNISVFFLLISMLQGLFH